MINQIQAQSLTREAFKPYGQVIEKAGSEHFPINKGKCIRHHALATAKIEGAGGGVIISIFSGQPYELPLNVEMVERHPLGSQAFYPLGTDPWLVVVCGDNAGTPIAPACFLASPDQGINLNPNVWHGVLTPLVRPSDFLVVDRGGEGENLEEFQFEVDQCFVVNAEI